MLLNPGTIEIINDQKLKRRVTMNTELGRMLILGSVVCLLAAGCEQRTGTDTQKGTDLSRTSDTLQTDLQKVAAKADQAAQQAKQEAEKATEQAQAEVGAKIAKAKELLAQAQELFDSGKLQAAIDKAQMVLNQYDPNSSLAKDIINTAKARLQQMAEEQAASVTEGVQDVIGGMGQ